MPEKETLDMLMKNQHQRQASFPNEFALIPRNLGEEERERIREVFNCYDVDDSGSLDTTELRGALADLGYCPQSREEKLQFSKILDDVDFEGDGELGMEEFEQAVVRVMDMLRNLQSMELFESFHLHDVDGTGSLSIDEVFDILPELGLGPRIDQEHEAIRQCVAKVDVDNSHEVDFNEFEDLLVEVRVRLHRLRRMRRRDIIHQSELDREIVETFKNEICELKDQFDCYDQDHSGFLDRKELNLLIADCGLGPRSKAEREEIQALIASSDTDHNAQVTFMEFLHLIRGIRSLSSARCQKDLQKLFKKFDKDGSGSMSFAECSRLLEHVGLSPKTQQEQRHIGVLLEATDVDGNGELDFEEFTHLCQRVKEMLQLVVHHKELKAAKSLNITIAQAQEYKLVFEQMDADGTGQLSVESVREMVDSLHIHISGDELHEIFIQVDEDDSGFIEFTEFLKLISMVYKHAAQSGMRFRT
jgi:Ca2+-binding EF-hand superfamily protein